MVGGWTSAGRCAVTVTAPGRAVTMCVPTCKALVSAREGVRAYGGSAIGGLIRAGEVQAGVINHPLAVSLALNQMQTGPVWPATSDDGGSASSYTGLIHMGSLIAIPRSVNLAALGLSPQGLMLATALQNYGAYVVDTGGAATFYAEPTNGMDMNAVGAMRNDIGTIVAQLTMVTNNTASTVGG